MSAAAVVKVLCQSDVQWNIPSGATDKAVHLSTMSIGNVGGVQEALDVLVVSTFSHKQQLQV